MSLPARRTPEPLAGLRATAAARADVWWKNAVLYSLDVATFCDSHGVGIGDFVGATERIDHLATSGAGACGSSSLRTVTAG